MLGCPCGRSIAKTGSTSGAMLVDNAIPISKRITALPLLKF